MAENKKAIVVYSDWIDKFEELEDDEAGRLIKHFFRYVNNLNPVAPDRTTKLMFIDIENTLIRDLEKWELKSGERSLSGRMGNLKRYNRDLYSQVVDKEITIEQAEVVAKSRKTSLSDNSDSNDSQNLAKLAVSVNGIVSESKSDILLKKETKGIVSIVQRIENSPYGDGVLHFKCKQYANENADKYPKEFYVSFLQYWTAPLQIGVHKGKEQWTREKTFNLPSRLANSFKLTWDAQNKRSINTQSTPTYVTPSKTEEQLQYEKLRQEALLQNG